MPAIPTLVMNDGERIPQLGFGVFQIDPEQTFETVRIALEAGYRLIDTAQGYGNEEGVGQAVVAGGVLPDDIFVTTKLNNSEHGYEKTLKAFEESRRKLRLDVVDLFLIHWPLPMIDQYIETWRAFEKLQADGLVRSIGVSNFSLNHLRRLLDETGIVPVVNQIELHPYFSQHELRAFHADHGILTEAWSPLGRGHGILEEPTLGSLAHVKGRSPAQIVLRWHIQLGNIAIPKSVHRARIIENLDVFDFSLDATEMEQIAALDRGERFGPDPAHWNMR